MTTLGPTLTTLPIELQLYILEYCFTEPSPILVSGFKDSTHYPSEIEHPFNRNYTIYDFPILRTCKLFYYEGAKFLFSNNTFLFTSPLSQRWSYARDWYWTFTFMMPEPTKKAVAKMKDVLFKCDGSLDGSLVGTVMGIFDSVEYLEFDFIDSWRFTEGVKKYEDVNDEFVDMVWTDIQPENHTRHLKELRFSGLKEGGFYWNEVKTYGERITHHAANIEKYHTSRTIR